MSGNNYLLDTNIVIGLFANESSILEKIKLQPSSIFIPSIVLENIFMVQSSGPPRAG
jgi:predicted nucleic acid-binding protein